MPMPRHEAEAAEASAVVTPAGQQRWIEIPAGATLAPVAAGVLKMAVVAAEMTVHIHLSVIDRYILRYILR